MKKIIAIIGGPGTGKTAVINELKRRGYSTIDEAAREIIDEGLSKGRTLHEIIGDVKGFQTSIVNRQEERLSSWSIKVPENGLLFMDRGVHDTWAYLTYAEVDLGDNLRATLNSHKYHHVFMLDMLEDYDHSDYARVEDRKHAEELHELIEQAYMRHGMDIKKIPVMSVEDRVDHILKIISD